MDLIRLSVMILSFLNILNEYDLNILVILRVDKFVLPQNDLKRIVGYIYKLYTIALVR